jgi:hypothetical protein
VVLVVLVSVVSSIPAAISAIVVLVMLIMLIVLKVLSMVSVVSSMLSKGHHMGNGGGMHKSTTTMMTAVVGLACKETSNKGCSADGQSSGRKSAHWHAVAGRGRWVVSSIGGCWRCAIGRMSSGVPGCCWGRVRSIRAGWVGRVRSMCAIGVGSIRSTVWWWCAIRRRGSAIGRRCSAIGGGSTIGRRSAIWGRSAIGGRSGSIGTGGWGSMSIGVMGCSAMHTGHTRHTGDMRDMGEAPVGCCRGS